LADSLLQLGGRLLHARDDLMGYADLPTFKKP
jgi:hypothetical protein